MNPSVPNLTAMHPVWQEAAARAAAEEAEEAEEEEDAESDELVDPEDDLDDSVSMVSGARSHVSGVSSVRGSKRAILAPQAFQLGSLGDGSGSASAKKKAKTAAAKKGKEGEDVVEDAAKDMDPDQCVDKDQLDDTLQMISDELATVPPCFLGLMPQQCLDNMEKPGRQIRGAMCLVCCLMLQQNGTLTQRLLCWG